MSNKPAKKLLALLVSAEMALGAALAAGPASAAESDSAPAASALAAQAAAQPAAQAGTPYAADGSYDAKIPHVVINQVYGGGGSTAADTYVSNGFVELYNPTDADVDLSGWSLQYADPNTSGAWRKLDLTGIIKAHSSFLVTGAPTGASAASQKLDISAKGDQAWTEQYINNKQLKVVLLSNRTKLDDANVNPFETKPAGYVDMLGTAGNDNGNTIDGYETAYPTGKGQANSKKIALRRSEFADTDNNKADFALVDYSSADAALLAESRPRSGSDGAWGTGTTDPENPENPGDPEVQPLAVATAALPGAQVGVAYSAKVEASGGKAPYTFKAAGLPAGLSLDSATGAISGTPAAGSEGAASVEISVTDSQETPASAAKTLTIQVEAAPAPGEEPVADKLSVTKIAGYSVGATDEDGGVAEIVKYNKDNGKFYLVNGSSNPPSLDIVALGTSGQLTKEKSLDVKPLSETNGFVYGDLTSVDVNTATKRVYLAVQEADPMKNGRILALDYDGKLLEVYEAGVQPDMIKVTSDGRYVLTADEAEPRTEAGDPEGSVTIVDTVGKKVVRAKFDDPSVIADNVNIRGNIRGASSKESPTIQGPGSKADAIFDLEPEFIALSGDEKTAYVSLQENNAIASVDIASGKVVSVKGLGLKDFSQPGNSLDLIKDGKIRLDNVPFYGMYMPDGIDSYTVGGKTYLFSANEGDATEWPTRVNAAKVKDLKAKLNPDSAAARFLAGKTEYDKVEAMAGVGTDSIYLYGGRSFSIWEAGSMSQAYDSGNDFEKITAQRLPEYFNAGHNDTEKDARSPKKGPEPEYVKVGQVGDRYLAFVGLERIGGIMTYDVTDPNRVSFDNYVNPRDFSKGLETDTGPEGLEFIPASVSPTGYPLLLVANEVGGTVSVLQVNVSKIELDKKTLSLKAGGASAKLTATVTPSEGGSTAVVWTSSNPSVATVDAGGNVKPLRKGTAVIAATTADGYAKAESVVTVASSGSSGGGSGSGSGSGGSGTQPTPTAPGQPKPPTVVTGDAPKVTTELAGQADSSGAATVSLTAEQADEALKALERSDAGGKPSAFEIKAAIEGSASRTTVALPAKSLAAIAASSAVDTLRFVTAIGTVSLDRKAIEAVSARAAGAEGDVRLTLDRADASAAAALPADVRSAVGSRPVYRLSVDAAGGSVTGFGGGTAKIVLPYAAGAGEDPNAVILYAFASNGAAARLIPAARFDAAKGELSFAADGLSDYAIGYRPSSFADANGSFAKNEISYLAARGIIDGNGSGSFEPKAKLTRADFALLLARVAGADLGAPGKAAFSDVNADAYYAPAVQWAADRGIVGGIGDGRFDPSARVTREQIAAMLARLIEHLNAELPAQAAPAAGFADEASIPAYAADAAKTMQAAGILSGKAYPNKPGVYFAPKDEATREEAAKLLASLMQSIQP